MFAEPAVGLPAGTTVDLLGKLICGRPLVVEDELAVFGDWVRVDKGDDLVAVCVPEPPAKVLVHELGTADASMRVTVVVSGDLNDLGHIIWRSARTF